MPNMRIWCIPTYGFCDGSCPAATIEEYRRQSPNRRIPDPRVFSADFYTEECFLKFSKHGVGAVHVPALSAHVSYERELQQDV